VEPDFPGLEFPLSLIQRFSIGIGFAQSFDRIPCLGEMIECRIHDTICARSQDGLELQILSEEYTYP